MTMAKFVIVFRSIFQATLRSMNKRENLWCSLVSKKDRRLQRRMHWSGESRPWNGAMMLLARRKDRQPARGRDPSFSYRAGRDLSAAFSCGGFSSLDIWRVEPSAARTAGFALPFALRDLRVRI